MLQQHLASSSGGREWYFGLAMREKFRDFVDGLIREGRSRRVSGEPRQGQRTLVGLWQFEAGDKAPKGPRIRRQWRGGRDSNPQLPV